MAWLLFGDRPSKERWFVIGVIYVGIMLTYNIFGVIIDENLPYTKQKNPNSNKQPPSMCMIKMID